MKSKFLIILFFFLLNFMSAQISFPEVKIVLKEGRYLLSKDQSIEYQKYIDKTNEILSQSMR